MRRPALKKRLGQHHLRAGTLCRPLIDYLRPEGERVLEIGPGGGVLTAELLAAGGRVIACEVDLEWALALGSRFAGSKVATVAVDAQRLEWRRLPRPTLVAGNLPFNVATRLVEGLLPCSKVVPRAAFMVQKEVAERLVARPGDSAYGSLSVLTTAYSEARLLGVVRPGSFDPPPRVSAAFVGLRLREPPLEAGEMPVFVRLVRLAFALRRKTLRNSLASGMGRELSGQLLDALGWDARCRAESLDLSAFVALFAKYCELKRQKC